MENNFWAHQSADISPDSKIGNKTKIWHNNQIMADAQIGENCNIGHNILVANGAIIGNNVKIQSNTDVWNGVVLEDYVFVGPSVVFTNDINPRSKYPKDKSNWDKTLIKEGATIGANATIVCKHTIGKSAFIGAGAVVSNDVPDYALVVGNPAKIIGWMCECGERIFENNENQCVCKKCQKEYKKEGEVVNLI